ncbi:MAG: hypothetical protein IKD21_01700 [Clostridia bacterium]|nr:hypothetical protein [Clostridia bacterium]
MKKNKTIMTLLIFATLTLGMLVLSVSVSAVNSSSTDNVTIYSQYGTAVIPENELEDYLAVGWSIVPVKLNNITQLPTTIYVSDSYGTDALDILQFDIDWVEYVSDSNKIRIHYTFDYAESGYVSLNMMCFDTYGNRVALLDFSKYADYIDVPENTATFSIVGKTSYKEHTSGGYYHCKQVDLYAMDGRIITVYDAQVPLYTAVGWYEAVTMYALDGRTIEIPPYEVEAYKNVGWYTAEGYLFELIRRDVNQFRASGSYEDAMELFDKYEKAFYGTEYQYSAQLLKEQVMDAWRNSLRCPLAYTGSYSLDEEYGVPEVTIWFRNVSYKKIAAFKLQFTCYNIFGDVENTYYSGYYCDSTNMDSGECWSYTWDLYGADSVYTIKNVRVTEIVFADGTKW